MSIKFIPLLCALVFGFNRLAVADDDFSKEVVKATQLTPTLYLLEGAGGNMTASIGRDGVLLVDCDFAEMSDKLVAKLKELKGMSPRYIVNTHFHYDHTGGNQVFGPTATIIATEEARTRLMSEQILWKKPHPAFAKVALPILTFDDKLAIHFNEDDIDVVHYAHGHTDGDAAVFFKNGKIASLGDLYFAGMYPIFHPEHGGSIEGYLRDIDLILQRLPDDARIIPGHGPLSNTGELKIYRQMIAESVAIVKAGIAKKLTLTQIRERGIGARWEAFSHGFRSTDQWIESIYQDEKRNVSL